MPEPKWGEKQVAAPALGQPDGGLPRGVLHGTGGAAHVRGLAELSYAIVAGEKVNQLDTPVVNKTTISLAGSEAAFLAIEYMDLGAATGKRLFVVFNASSDTDANNKLSSASQRYVVPIDGWREWYFELAERLTRVDFCSDAASESSSLVTWEYGLL